MKNVIEAAEATLDFPAYSPDFSPIENIWSKIKTALRKYARCSLKAFKKAITKAFKSITKNDLAAWFKHCRYSFKQIRKPL